jgi:large conductance mechanosensitive channel
LDHGKKYLHIGAYAPDINAGIGIRWGRCNWTSHYASSMIAANTHLYARRQKEQTMTIMTEFKAFIARGNVMDLAVGVIIGGAFATITKSLTDDLIMPVVGFLFGGADFSRYFLRLGAIPATFKGNPESYAELKAAGVAMLGWGEFMTVVVNFLILAFIIFLMVKMINKMLVRHEKEQAAEAPPTPEEVVLLREIRDSLRK